MPRRSTNKTIMWCNGTNHFSSLAFTTIAKQMSSSKQIQRQESPLENTPCHEHYLCLDRKTKNHKRLSSGRWGERGEKGQQGKRKQREHLAWCCEMCACVSKKVPRPELYCRRTMLSPEPRWGRLSCWAARHPGSAARPTINAAMSSCLNGPGTRLGMKDTQWRTKAK